MDAATRDRHQRAWLNSSSVGLLALLLVACGASARPLQARGQISTYVVNGGGVTDCYAPRQTAEARTKCMGELAQMQRFGTSVVLDSACGSGGRSYVEPGVSFTPVDVRSSRKPWPDNSHSCTFSIQVQCCFVQLAPAQILQSAQNPRPAGPDADARQPPTMPVEGGTRGGATLTTTLGGPSNPDRTQLVIIKLTNTVSI